MNPLIEVSDLSFSYNKTPLLDKVSFTVNRGDFVGIIGPNGSGKSTLVKLMLKILPSESGEIRLLGEPIATFKDWNKIGYVSQKANAFNGSFPATVEEIVQANLFSKIGLFKFPRKKHKEMVYQALEKVDMAQYGKRLIGNLSGGQQQRVFIARTLVNEPELLFLDEPTVGIDAKSEEAVYCLLARLNQTLGLTVVMVTHDIGAITVHANRLLCLGDTGLIEHNIREGMTQEALTQLYGYPVQLHAHECQNCCERGAH